MVFQIEGQHCIPHPGWLQLRPGWLWGTRAPSFPSLAPLPSTGQFYFLARWLFCYSVNTAGRILPFTIPSSQVIVLTTHLRLDPCSLGPGAQFSEQSSIPPA